MEAPASSQPPPTQESGTSRQQPKRPRRGRGQGRNGGENASVAFRPASVAPAATSEASTDTQPRQRGPGGRGRGNGRGRGGKQTESRTTANGRTFGGQLTREETNSSDQNAEAAQLQGSAPVFVPGQQHVQNITQTTTKKQPKQPRQPKRRASKSQAPDIATRTHEDIDNGHYECAICTSDVRRNSKVWSCHTCWTVFHLKCIAQWSSNQGSAMNQQAAQNDDLQPPRQWRCPGCNLPKDEFPKFPTSYTCWCEKELDPKAPTGIPPHSCGQTCGKGRVRKCPHRCQLTCHAGPCPPCSHMGPTQNCFCGNHESTKRCSETDYTSGSWSCGDVCGAVMACDTHHCPRPCHDGPCGPCEVRLPSRCYCGQVEKEILCSAQGEHKASELEHKSEFGEFVQESWIGVFDCGNISIRAYDCGAHQFEEPCSPQEPKPAHCPRSPDVVTTCSCGKTALAEMTNKERKTCEDPIPACGKPCDNILSCGHSCPQICHSGVCPPCKMVVSISCRCGRTTSNSTCHQGHEEKPQCRRICRVNLNCGRHMCDEHCCAGERKAVERQASRKKGRPLDSAPRLAEDGFEAEHICTRQCGRPLKCGNHFCEELCHKGPCGSCREAIFEEISCNCGRTILQPPLPCGTQPPPCREPCKRPKACGHPQVAHNCHDDDASCPKCPFLVEKRCMCSKRTLKNQQCWLRDVSCGEICGKALKCGVHQCRKACHRGSCQDANGEQCKQPCGKEKKICGHPDEAPCHAPFSCKEEKPCTSRIFITCECQAQKQEMKCGASKSGEGNLGKSLPCNDECARLERNRKLALALNIDQSSHVDGGDHIPYSTETLNIFSQHVKWAQTQEREFRVFAGADDEKRLRFKPMQPQQRAFIHSLAEDFGFDSDSVDPEPHRHVMIWKTPRFVSAPNKTLAEALRLGQQAQRSANASANVSDNEGAMPAKSKPKPVEPYNSFRITKSRFGLTIDEVRAEANTVLHPSTSFTFDIEFLPSEDIILKAVGRTLPPAELEKMLQNLKMPLATAIAAKGYGTTQLCTIDSSLNITRYESDGSSADGWSRVAAKKAAPKMNASSGGLGLANNSFTALAGGGKVTFAKKKPKEPAAPVVDDWEAAEIAEEEKERAASASEDEDGVPAHDTAAVPPVETKDWADEVESSLPVS